MRHPPSRNPTAVRPARPRRGVALIYVMGLFLALCGICSLAVDLARVQLAKGELQHAADAAARHACSALARGESFARANAYATAYANKCDRQPVVLNDALDVEVGTWTAGTGTFAVAAANQTAVKVTARRTSARGNPVGLVFASLIGQKTCDVEVRSIAYLATTGKTHRVEGIANLWFAGMPDGTYGGATNTGTNPTNAPTQVTGVPLTAGEKLTFDVVGSCADDPVNINYGWTPDGQPGGIRTNDTGYLHGMANMTGQQASLIGVFLTDAAPNTSAAPPALDFSTQAARDYTTLAPQLKQPFYIGDGHTSGGTLQQITIPAGATRLYLAMHDNVNWDNNSGFYTITINGSGAAKIRTVR